LRTFFVIVIAVGVIALAGIPMFMHPTTAYTGIRLHRTGALIQPNIIEVAPGSPADRAGLQSGDIVSCLSTRDYELLFGHDLGKYAEAFNAGTPTNLCVRRGNEWVPLSFVPEVRPPAPDTYFNPAFAAFRLAAYVAFLLCAVFLVLGRPGRATWTFFAYAVIAAPNFAIEQNLSILDPLLFAVLYNASIVAISVQYALLMQFAVLVPNDRPPPGWRTVAYQIALGATVLMVLFAIVRVITWWTVTSTLIAGVTSAMALLVIAVIVARLAAMEREERGRFGWAAFAIGWAVTIDFLRQATVFPGPIGGVFGLTLLVTPVALMYAILKRHVIDISFAISRTLVYGIITTVAVIAIGAIDWVTSTYMHEARFAMALDAVVTIGIAFTLNRIHRQVEAIVDSLLFRKKYEAELFLKRLGRTLMSANHEETVDRALVRDPYKRLHLSMAALFRKTENRFVLTAAAGSESSVAAFDPDHDLVRFLCSEKVRVNLSDLTENPFEHACVATPIHQGPDMTGFAVYGIHRDGTALDPDELETLDHLCDAAAQAYTYIEVSGYRAERFSVSS
jgi:hypothetical protein